MLTGLRLGNFKAFGETQNIPIKPLTLIFGANSAGKSSIIHGLLLAHHAIQTGELNVYKTKNHGDAVDLGGVQQYMHRHEQARKLHWGGKVSTQAPYFLYTTVYALFKHFTGKDWNSDSVFDQKFLECFEMISNLDYDLTFNATTSRPFLETYAVQADSETLLHLTRAEDERLVPAYVNYKHPFFKTVWNILAEIEDETNLPVLSGIKTETYDEFFQQPANASTKQHVLEKLSLHTFAGTSSKANIDWKHWDDTISKWNWHRNYADAFIPKNQTYSVRDERKAKISLDFVLSKANEEQQSEIMEYRSNWFDQISFEAFLGDFVFALAMILETNISNVVHIGPVRSYPERFRAIDEKQFYLHKHNQSEESHFSDLLAYSLHSVNQWLGSSRMNTPYELQTRRYSSEDPHVSAISEYVLHDKRFDTTLRFEDVGAGISQVLPVLMSADYGIGYIVAIEQPELHLHPALQAELGDVFIEAALGDDQNTFLLETHSEHLILRIMRRMRDTVRGTLPEGMPPVRPEDVAILYVDRKDDDSTSVVSVLELDEEGQLLDPWPGGFFEEGFNERFA